MTHRARRSAVPSYTMLVNGDSLRWEHYQRSLLGYWSDRGQTPVVHVVDWRDAIARDGHIADLLPGEPSIFRMHSPARGFDVQRALLQAGERKRGVRESDWKEPRPGWMASPGLLYQGFQSVVSGVQESLDARVWREPQPSPYTCRDVLCLFDKNRTSELLEQAGLPVPDWFLPSGSVDALLQELRQHRMPNAYVKLNSGSCASGIAVIQVTREGIKALTTMIRLQGQFHNTRRLQRVSGEGLRILLQFLLDEGATVQRAIRKSEVDGQNFDVRFVVIRGRFSGAVFRASSHPITNLHLGGRRADPHQCRSVISKRHWWDAVDSATAAASLFSVPSVGIDVVFERTTSRPYIIEANAFGDFFPNWLDDQGKSFYDIDVASTAAEADCGAAS